MWIIGRSSGCGPESKDIRGFDSRHSPKFASLKIGVSVGVMILATIHDRKELQVLARMKAETAQIKKGVKIMGSISSILAQAPHLGWKLI